MGELVSWLVRHGSVTHMEKRGSRVRRSTCRSNAWERFDLIRKERVSVVLINLDQKRNRVNYGERVSVVLINLDQKRNRVN